MTKAGRNALVSKADECLLSRFGHSEIEHGQRQRDCRVGAVVPLRNGGSTRSMTFSCGISTSVYSTSWEPEARMPRLFQFSMTRMPGSSFGTTNVPTRAGVSSVCAQTRKWVRPCAPVTNRLRPVIDQPDAVRRATVAGRPLRADSCPAPRAGLGYDVNGDDGGDEIVAALKQLSTRASTSHFAEKPQLFMDWPVGEAEGDGIATNSAIPDVGPTGNRHNVIS